MMKATRTVAQAEDDSRQQLSCAKTLRVLADETRLAVLEQLLEGDRCVGAINGILGVEQSLLSHHLRVLRDAGLVTSRRDGKQVLYSMVDQVVMKQSARAIDLGCCSISFHS